MSKIVMMCEPQFVPKILNGSKHTTIRKIRKRNNPKPGDVLSLRRWTGKPYGKGTHQEVIKEVVCKEVNLITIFSDRVKITDQTGIHWETMPRYIASEDGFSSWVDMSDWFQKTYGLPFEGNLIRWE
jgi:hypothetical protein